MSHNILERDIQTGIKMAWHNLTNVVEEITRENSGIDYEMDCFPSFIEINGEKIRTNQKHVVSLDDNKVIGNAVGLDYAMISNGKVLDMVEEALSGTSHKIVSIGTVDNRQIGFISVQIDSAFKAAKRATESVLNFHWGHGGKLALIAKTGFTVQVCQNTINLAMKERGDFKMSLKHTKNSVARIGNMSKAIEAYLSIREEFKVAMNAFANVSVDTIKAEKIFAGLIAPENAEDEGLSTRAENTIERLGELFKSGKGNDGDGLDDVFNAITDYYTHESSNKDNPWKQNVSSEFGAGSRMKELAYNTFRDTAALNKVIKRGEKVLVATAQS